MSWEPMRASTTASIRTQSWIEDTPPVLLRAQGNLLPGFWFIGTIDFYSIIRELAHLSVHGLRLGGNFLGQVNQAA